MLSNATSGIGGSYRERRGRTPLCEGNEIAPNGHTGRDAAERRGPLSRSFVSRVPSGPPSARPAGTFAGQLPHTCDISAPSGQQSREECTTLSRFFLSGHPTKLKPDAPTADHGRWARIERKRPTTTLE